MLLQVGCHLFDRSHRIESVQLTYLFVVLDYWIVVVVKHLQSLLYHRLHVIVTSAGLPPLDEPSLQLILLALEIEHRFNINSFGHHLFPNIHVLLSPGEPVKKISTSVVILLQLLFHDSYHKFA
jgi:hypothetical protein